MPLSMSDTEYAGTVYANEWFNVSLTYSNFI